MRHTPEFLDYRSTLPKDGRGVIWTIESFSKAVTLLAPGYIVEDGQTWLGTQQTLTLVCPEHAPYVVRPRKFLDQSLDSGCASCRSQKRVYSAGKRRTSRATEAVKNEARRLYLELGNYCEVARILGSSPSTIQSWCKPELAERHRLVAAKWREENRERHNANTMRYQKEFSHGKASSLAKGARRRKRERGEMEWIDEVSGLVNLLTPPTTGEDLTKEQAYYLECERLTKETGITHHVDHIWPLSQGGPHIFYNLQVITADENLSKGNKYRPEDQALYAMRVAMLFDGTI